MNCDVEDPPQEGTPHLLHLDISPTSHLIAPAVWQLVHCFCAVMGFAYSLLGVSTEADS